MTAKTLAGGCALVALSLVLVVAACGGDDEGEPQVASLGEDDVAATTTTTSTTAQDPEEAMLAFARCMREHGIDVPDPDSSGRVRIQGPGGAAGKERPSDAQVERFQEAQEACGDLLDDARPVELSEEDRAAMQEAMLAYARCMRGEGLDFPDPEFGEGGRGGFTIRARGPRDGGPGDEEFEAADEKCRVHLKPIEDRFGKPQTERRSDD
jgi:hypothetical protein